MRRTAKTLALLCLWSPRLVQGGETPSTTEAPTDIRREMLSEYKFSAADAKPGPSPSSLRSSLPVQAAAVVPESKEVVKMDPFEVRESGAPSAALMPLAYPPSAPARTTVASKLGIGNHKFQVGKMHMFVSTVFYVPFLIGFEW